MARTAPPPPPVSFGVKQRALEANPGRPLDAGTVDNLRRTAPAQTPMVRTIGRGASQANTPPGPGGLRQANPGNNSGQNPPPAQQSLPRNDNPQRTLDRPSPAPANVQRPPNVVQPPAVQRPANDRPAAAPANPVTPREAAPQQRNVEKKQTKKADKTPERK